MAKADYNYRADPSRSITVFGQFSDDLINRVLFEICALRAKNAEPITVFVNSPGGLVRGLDVIRGAITAKDADGNGCRMITVAAGDCSSAAASLFTLGGYAIAYPHSNFHFHGVRLSEVEVTMEDATSIAHYLAGRNRAIALDIANSMIARLIFRYLLLIEEVAKRQNEAPDESPLQSFALCLQSRVSLHADQLLERTMKHVQRVLTLSAKVLKSVKLEPGEAGIKHDTKVFRAVLAYELRLNRGSDWRLDSDGLTRVSEDYFLLRDFYIGEHHAVVESLIEGYGHYFLEGEAGKEWREKQAADGESAKKFLTEKTFPLVKLFWYFTIVLARLLQQGENRLEAEDAYWLGAADEVVGTEMRGERMIMEEDFPPDSEIAPNERA